MKLSQTTHLLFDCFGETEGIRTAAETGFDALDLNLCRTIFENGFEEENLERTCSLLKKTAEENGICFNQAHAPYPFFICLADRYKMDSHNKRMRDAVIRSIKITSLVGAEIMILHPVDYPDKSVQKEFNLELYNSFVPYCKEYGVKIALENMWTAYENGKMCAGRACLPNVCSYSRDLVEYIDELDERYFTVCLDLGHCGIVGQDAAEAIYELGGKRLGALHVHDNDNINDLHTTPYKGKMDWDKILKALKDINYSGDFTFEILDKCLLDASENPVEMRKEFEAMAKTGRDMIAKII